MVSTIGKFTIGIASLAAIVGMSGASAAYATTDQHSYQAVLQPLNKSGDTGSATTVLTTNGDGTFTIRTTGASPSLAHAQHIHIGGTNTCPDISADKDKDGLINTTEGTPSYGPIEISLTTTGDTSKDSGLAVDRFPTADAKGNVTYERTFPLPEGVTEDMVSKGVIVTHGISEVTGDKAKYDGDKKSDIPGSEALPLEATIPAACGKLTSMPVGGVNGGTGSIAGLENVGLMVAGAAALVAGGALVTTRRSGLFNK
jgi:hypothetical protein